MPRQTLDVYDSDGDAFEATADRVAALLQADHGSGRLAVALSGGRGGRGVMIALSARPDLPWARIDWYFADDRCVPPDDQHSNVRLARENLLGPRRVPAAQIMAPPAGLDEPTAVAAAYAATLTSKLGGDPPVFDLVLLGIGPDGHVASLAPGCAALRATTAVAVVEAGEMRTAPAVARITLTPRVLAAARHVLVTACGKEKAAAVAAALKEPHDPLVRPAQCVSPSERVGWILDLTAADGLIHDAVPAPQ
mgnify:CR=1 FL=1